jgi:hypothetical protein
MFHTGQEGHPHVHPVQPELVRIALLVPEGAFGGARVIGELRGQGIDSFAVFGVTVPRMEALNHLARLM